MKKILHVAFIAILSMRILAADSVPIIPAPTQAIMRDGTFHLTRATVLETADEFKGEAKLLADRLRIATGYPIKIKSLSKDQPPGCIVLIKTDHGDSATGEDYSLAVKPDSVVVRAPTGAGAFYGTQSLLQLLPPEIFSRERVKNVDWQIPCVEIMDAPRFAWRGFMLDVSRHFFTKKEVEQVLDLLALYKMNTFHWHLVDDQGWRIEIKKYPKLTQVGAWRDGIGFGLDPTRSWAYNHEGRYGGYYTQQEIREVVAYTAARHITIVPEIEMPGHSSAALMAYPQFLCPNTKLENVSQKGGVFKGVYCAGNDGTFTFLDDVLGEVAQLFPGKYIHIGGDEVPKANWIACPECQARIHSEHLKDEKELQAYFTRRIEKILDSHGKSLIGWSEIREGGLAPSAALMDWIGGGAESAASGHDVVMAPTKFCYFDYYQSTNHAAEPKAIGGFVPLQKVYQFDPMPANLAPELQRHVLGGQANLWAEYVPNLAQVEYMMLPRIGALSEVDWSPKEARNWDDFKARAALNEKRLDAMKVNYRPLSKPD